MRRKSFDKKTINKLMKISNNQSYHTDISHKINNKNNSTVFLGSIQTLSPIHQKNRENLQNPCLKYYKPVNSENKGVSYGELQIILENLKRIKIKAKEQVHVLEEENKIIKQELKNLKYKIKIQSERNKTNNKQELENTQQLKKQIQVLNRKLQQSEDQLQIIIKQNQVNKKQLIKSNQHYNNTKLQLNVLSENYSNIVNIITNNNPVRLNQFQNKMVKLYEKKGESHQIVFDLISQFEKQNKILRQQIDNLKMISVEYNSHLKHNDELLSRLTQQNSQLLSNINQKQHFIESINVQQKQQTGQYKMQLQSKGTIIKQLEQKIHKLQQILNTLNSHHTVQLQKMKEQMNQLQIELEKQVSINVSIHRQKQYNRIVEQVCSQNDDFKSLLQRSEYYNMVEKMQYMGKMMDQ